MPSSKSSVVVTLPAQTDSLMKVALTTTSVHPHSGGPAYSVPAINRNLTLAGIDSVLLTQNGALVDGAGRPAAHRRIADSEIVHNFGIWTPFHHAVCVATRLARRPMVCCPMGMLEPWSLAQKPLRKRLAMSLYERRNLQYASALHATAMSEADSLRTLGLQTPIAVIPHGVEIPALPPHRGPANRPVRTALFLSRMHPKKGLLTLVEAWDRLQPRDWRLVIAGPDEAGHRAVVESEVARAGLEDRIVFAGMVVGDQKRALLLCADLFLLPTFSENFGNVVPEALAYGVPVITTTAAPWRELVETGSGWWIQTGLDPLVQALREALSQTDSSLFAMGQRGRAMVEERYSWTRIAAKYSALYEWIVRGGETPDFVAFP